MKMEVAKEKASLYNQVTQKYKEATKCLEIIAHNGKKLKGSQRRPSSSG
jgi:hypothetical protein